MGFWLAIGRYDDGTETEKKFPYLENGNYNAEEQRKYELESWLIEQHEGCNFYSVDYVEE